MSEYIEREKYVKFNDIIETLEHEWGYEGMREDLYNLPTADVVEVVRCKDCAIPHNKFLGCPYLNGLVPPENHFCSYGKRKEGAEE